MNHRLHLLVILMAALFSGCRHENNNQNVISQRYFHKYGYAISKEDWETGNYPGQVITHLRNGVTVTSTYENGVLHGPSTHTYPHSQTIEAYYLYTQGNLVKEVLYDVKSMPLRETVQLSPTRYSTTLWYADGSPLSIEEYAGEELLEGQYFTVNNEIESRIEKGSGIRIRRTRDGTYHSKDWFESGYMVRRESFYPSGSPESVSYYHQGKLHGEQKNFAENGEPLSVAEWVHGQLHGKCTYFKNGSKAVEISYLNDQKNGLEVRYLDGQKISQEIQWENDRKHGPTVFHLDDDRHTEWYYDGKKISFEEYERLSHIDEMISAIPDELHIDSDK